jgi:prevent-host-death family protein
MKTATITHAKNGLSALIDRVRAGETILLTDRGVPVARLEPVTTGPDPAGRLGRLQRKGLVRVGVAPAPVDLLLRPGPRLDGDVSGVDVLIAERRSGR